MTHFNITVPDNRAIFFQELLNSLSFAKVEPNIEFELTEAHKSIIGQRLENYKNNPDSYRDWEEVQKEIDVM